MAFDLLRLLLPLYASKYALLLWYARAQHGVWNLSILSRNIEFQGGSNIQDSVSPG